MVDLLVLVLVVVAIILYALLASLKERVLRLEAALISTTDALRRLEARTAALGRGAKGTPPPEVTAPAAPTTVAAAGPDSSRASSAAPAPPVPPAAEPAGTAAVSVPATIAAPAAMTTRPVAAPIPAAAGEHPMDELSADLAARTRRTDAVPRPAPLFAGSAEPAPTSGARSVAAAESWEMVVGTSWLNKIGVFVFVIGLALLVAYSFAHIGPAGRVAIGFALSAGLLGAGAWLERRAGFRNYAYTLVAGGWAGTYFTAFAMHGVEAAKVIDSDVLAGALLFAVAGGMIAHSLRYRSEIVTSLAFIVAYATLALSPVTGFSLAASVPLAFSLLVVSQRLGWPAISALGVMATYGVFALRTATFPGTLVDGSSSVPYLTLAAYWLTFESADLIGLRLGRRDENGATGPTNAPSMLALNAVGIVTTMVMVLPLDPEKLSIFLFAAGAAYVASAALRARLASSRHTAGDAGTATFHTAHAATAIAAALFGSAIAFRFSGTRETLALLLEAQLLFTAGLTLRDVWLRRFASIVAVPATVHAWARTMDTYSAGGMFAAPDVSLNLAAVVAGVMGVAWVVNREWLRTRGWKPTWAESVYTWMATALFLTTFLVVLEPAPRAFAGLVLAVLLLEWGARRGPEYAWQAYAAGLIGAWGLTAAFLIPADGRGRLSLWGLAPTAIHDWTILPASIALTVFAAWRLASRADDRVPGRTVAAGMCTVLGVLFALIFEWRVLPAEALAPAWAMTALSLVGAARRVASLRRLGYAVALGPVSVRVALALLDQPVVSMVDATSIAVAIALVYATAHFDDWRTNAAPRDEGDTATAALLSTVATALLTGWKFRVVPEAFVAPAWAMAGATLLAIGLRGRVAVLRWQGLVLVAMGLVRAADAVLGAADPAARAILWLAVCLGLAFGCSIATGRAYRDAEANGETRTGEHLSANVLAIGATWSLAQLILREVRPSLTTLALGLQGVGLMAAGLLARARVLRLSALAVLADCILKLFVVDLRELEALARILSFVALGLFLLAISWVYTRYRDQLRKLL